MFRHIFIKRRDTFLKNLLLIECRDDNVNERTGNRSKRRLVLSGGEVPRPSQWLGYGCCFHVHASNYNQGVCNFALSVYEQLIQHRLDQKLHHFWANFTRRIFDGQYSK